jgi:hypothetical protein
MARQKVDHISPSYPSMSTCGPVDRPIVVDEYEKFAEHFLGDYEEEINVTAFMKEVAC